MRKLLNTLYVTTPDSYLSRDGENVVVSQQQKEIFKVPIINIEAIVTFGYLGVSPALMKLCSDHNVTLTFLSLNGHFIGRLEGKMRGNVLLRKKQYTLSEQSEFSLHVSQLFISGKIQNYRTILKRYIRDYGDNKSIKEAIDALGELKNDVFRSADKVSLMGIEGMAASVYFGVFPNLLTQQKEGFPFNGRNRRPPKDAVNAMLSFVYTLITNDVISALETVGLDPYVGFLHSIRPGRASLALDMIEELRAYMGDRFVISLINRKQIEPNHFLYQGEQGVTMKDEARKIFLSAWQKRKNETIVQPYLNEKISIGLIPYVQSLLLTRYLRGDIDDYPVFLIK